MDDKGTFIDEGTFIDKGTFIDEGTFILHSQSGFDAIGSPFTTRDYLNRRRGQGMDK